ncbi:hypothetical protein AB4Z39_10820 [Mycobacterium adipatum]|uniref:DUF7572 family protein n=1 Tax=Mycobacterium adipatum TaxID=1682113 RepID=UPI0034E0C04E
METATLTAANLSQFCPVTNHYQCSDGRWLLVTIASMDVPETVSYFLGVRVPIAEVHLPVGADVFLSDENATVLDADGDPANGMTPLATFNVNTHAAALAALGYEEVL